MEDGIARVEAAPVEEIGAQRPARSLGGHEDHIDVLGRDDVGLVAVGDGKAMGEVEGLALGQMGFYLRPHLGLSGIGQEILENRSPLSRFFHREEGLAGNESVLYGLFPGRAALPLPHDDADAVVAEVQGLAWPLRAVAQNGHRFVLQDLLGLVQGKFIGGDDLLPYIAEFDLCHVFLLKG